MLDQHLQERLSESLNLYYDSLKSGDLKNVSSLMTKDSYIMILESLGFKRAFRDSDFKVLLKSLHEDESALEKVEEVISQELKDEFKDTQISVVNLEENGPDRVTLHYLENEHPKKMYFSSSSGEYKIDYKAGRKTY